MILLDRGECGEARDLLAAQARDHADLPGHQAYVVDLAQRLGIDIRH
jgi:hypothetical protein